MTRNRTLLRSASAALLAAAVCLASGCTLFDDYVPGTPFTPDQPEKELTIVGGVNIDPSSGSDSCPGGRTLFWGLVRNTGDLDLVGVSIIVDAFDASGALLGSFGGSVFNGTVEAGEGDVPDTAGTSLAVDESGNFAVCSSLPFGTVARAEGRADGHVIEVVEAP